MNKLTREERHYKDMVAIFSFFLLLVVAYAVLFGIGLLLSSLLESLGILTNLGGGAFRLAFKG